MPKPKSVLRLWSAISLDEWAKSRENREYARALGQDPMFQKMLMVLLNQRPINSAPRGYPMTQEMCAIELGRMQGYEDCFALLNLMLRGETPKQPEPVTEEYGADERNTETD